MTFSDLSGTFLICVVFCCPGLYLFITRKEDPKLYRPYKSKMKGFYWIAMLVKILLVLGCLSTINEGCAGMFLMVCISVLIYFTVGLLKKRLRLSTTLLFSVPLDILMVAVMLIRP